MRRDSAVRALIRTTLFFVWLVIIFSFFPGCTSLLFLRADACAAQSEHAGCLQLTCDGQGLGVKPAPVPPQEPTVTPATGQMKPEPVGGEGGEDAQKGEGFSLPNLNNLLIVISALVLAFLLGGLLVFMLWTRGRKRKNVVPSRPHAVPKSGFNSPDRPCLLWESNAEAPRYFALKPEGLTLGRAADNAIVIDAAFPGWETVSRHHARIYRQGDYWVVEDLGSRNGTYVNGGRTGCNLLRDNWKLGIGEVVFSFHDVMGEAHG